MWAAKAALCAAKAAAAPQPPLEPECQWPAEQHLELEGAQLPLEQGRQRPAERVLGPLLRQVEVEVVWVENNEVDSDLLPGRQWPAVASGQHLELERAQRPAERVLDPLLDSDLLLRRQWPA